MDFVGGLEGWGKGKWRGGCVLLIKVCKGRRIDGFFIVQLLYLLLSLLSYP